MPSDSNEYISFTSSQTLYTIMTKAWAKSLGEHIKGGKSPIFLWEKIWLVVLILTTQFYTKNKVLVIFIFAVWQLILNHL